MPDPPAAPNNPPRKARRQKRGRPAPVPAIVPVENGTVAPSEAEVVTPAEAAVVLLADEAAEPGRAGDTPEAEAVPTDDPPPPPPSSALATLIGEAGAVGRPTWMDVPPERVGELLAAFADEGARLLAMTVLPPGEDAPADPSAVDLRYHFAVGATTFTVNTRTPVRQAPSAAGLFPAMAWRERELAGEYGLRFAAGADLA